MIARRFLVRGAVLAIALAGFAIPAAAKSRQPVAGRATVKAATATDLRMDAVLRMTLERHAARPQHASGAAGDRRLDAEFPYGALKRGASGEAALDVFLELSNAGAAHELAAHGAEVLVQRGELALARIPLASIAGVAASPGVRYMAGSTQWSARIDSSRIRTRVRDVHQGGGTLPQAYNGAGVIVGVLDSGLDFTHDDFRTSAADSRLLALLDFTPPGLECTAAQLDANTCTQIDGSGGFGHGTHVTGIAAGNGRRNPVYVGMAPQADLLFVKGIRDAQSNGGFDDGDVINGVAWMLNKALAAGQPIAINLSLGGQFGAHDGTSTQERFMDQFAGPGRIIVAAAGNSGGDPIHASYAVQGTNYQTALETGWVLQGQVGLVDLWAPGGSNIRVGVAAYNPFDVFAGPVAASSASVAGQVITETMSIPGGNVLGRVTIDAVTTADPNNGSRRVLIQIQGVAGGIDPTSVLWSVYTFGTGTFDMWSLSNSFFLGPGFTLPSYFRPGDDSKTVGMPGTARRILCVGSHVTKTQWIDVDDTLRVRVGATLDAVSGFSSRGPSRDGRILPNLTAPGEAIISALSKDFPAERRFIVQGGGYQEQQGTSQAAPHITGIVALMLQRDPALTPENVRSILQQTATPTGGNPNNTFGSGRVQALAALQATPDPLACTVILPNGALLTCEEAASQPMSLMAYPVPAPGQVRFAFTTPARERVDLAVYDVMGRRLRTLLRGDVEPGAHSPMWNGDDDQGRLMPTGVYFARLIGPGGTRTVRLMLRR